MIKQGRVITTDFKLVKVISIAVEDDEQSFTCAAIDSEGNLYVWGILKHFLPKEKTILNQCWDDAVSDEEFMCITTTN
jgi:hypothetical protein